MADNHSVKDLPKFLTSMLKASPGQYEIAFRLMPNGTVHHFSMRRVNEAKSEDSK